MNYLILKSIVDATISHFHCKECGASVSERDVSILESGAQGVHMGIHCSKCHDVSNVRAEINVINGVQDIEKITDSGAMIARMMNVETSDTGLLVPEKLIQDEDIVSLRNKLKDTASVQDLFQ